MFATLSFQFVFDHQDGDVFGCVADVGWITGHSYVVYGPLCNGATTVLFESTPVYPNPGKTGSIPVTRERRQQGTHLSTCSVLWPCGPFRVSPCSLNL